MVKKIICVVTTFSLLSFRVADEDRDPRFPYQEVGLTETQAAAHLLNRFTFGPRPGQVDDVVGMGLEKWFERQLDAKEKDEKVDERLAGYETQHLGNADIAQRYVRNGQGLRMAMKEGVIDSTANKKENREELKKYLASKGLKPQGDLVRETINQKIIRAAYSENQLREVLTDFWFNHFNVSFTKNSCALFIPSFERASIRPNALGDFDKLLMATAQSPAMLMYLDNFSSVGENSTQALRQMKNGTNPPKRKKGLNENYAREVMELHTLGVDGGYTQTDVTEAARILTGWTISPMPASGDFLFAANRHDTDAKKVLGKTFPAGGGYEEGVELLQVLAKHPSTAKFIAKKIAIRFVSDNPPQGLIDKMSQTFLKQNGNIREVLRTMVSSKEFWQQETLREKTKSPFELVISAVRSLNADVIQPFPLAQWLTRMGQRIYYYNAPTGFPDRADYWINTSSLLNRMNFGLALSTQSIPGVKFDLLKLNNGHEPESAADALKTYARIMLPGRDLEKTIERLTPMLNDPNLGDKIEDAASKHPVDNQHMDQVSPDDIDSLDHSPLKAIQQNTTEKYRLSQIVGIMIGSPEFQRR